jgi:exosortase
LAGEDFLNYQQPAMTAKAKPFVAALSMPETVIFGLGCAALALPTLFQVARDSWSTEQGGHGPLVLATGIWALWRELHQDKIERGPGKLSLAVPLLALLLTTFVLARITGILEVEAFAAYGALIASAYLLVGSTVLRAVWFPLVYLGFTLPPPDTAVAAITQPIKIAISEWAVTLLHTLGYPIASSGVTIQIGQYQLLVAAACAGLNSIVTLTALCMFYVYLQHRSNPRAFLLMMIAAIPIAIIANFVRVLALVLITYYYGEAAAQGFLHDFAGILMFAVALATVFAVDKLATPLFAKASRN